MNSVTDRSSFQGICPGSYKNSPLRSSYAALKGLCLDSSQEVNSPWASGDEFSQAGGSCQEWNCSTLDIYPFINCGPHVLLQGPLAGSRIAPIPALLSSV